MNDLVRDLAPETGGGEPAGASAPAAGREVDREHPWLGADQGCDERRLQRPHSNAVASARSDEGRFDAERLKSELERVANLRA